MRFAAERKFILRRSYRFGFSLAAILPFFFLLPSAASGAPLTVRATRAQLDLGWTGLAWNATLPEGSAITLREVRRCSETGSPCATNADCSGGTCQSTCDPSATSVCELTGPTGTRRCLRTFAPCAQDTDCPSEQCVYFFGPPEPRDVSGVPTCATNVVAGDVTGTRNLTSGEGTLQLSLRRHVHLGISPDQPCPSCGTPSQNPQIGDRFQCSGGANDGASCTVDGVSSLFGGVSFDCPPDPSVSIATLVVRTTELTTGRVVRQATLPCGGDLGSQHPGSGGSICIDDASPCTTNADCKRCTSDLLVACTTNADCPSGGTCEGAPDIPVTCGVYCHCGYCGGDPDQPCFDDTECTAPDHCEAGDGIVVKRQGAPNPCSGLICGAATKERCCNPAEMDLCLKGIDTPSSGNCSSASEVPCNSNSDCGQGEGVCVPAKRPCFENLVDRRGTPVPADPRCGGDSTSSPCTTNADCSSGGCLDASAPSTYVGLVCVGGITSRSVSSVVGLPGPAALHLALSPPAPAASECGNGIVEPGEDCDGTPCCSQSCTDLPAGTACVPDDACLGPGQCDDRGQCISDPGGAVDCDDANECTTDQCDPATGSCLHTPLDGTPCDDGNPATRTVCRDGGCAVQPTLCSDVPRPDSECQSPARAVLRIVRPVADNPCNGRACCAGNPIFRDRIFWKWLSPERSPAPACTGPAQSSSYQLCIYDSSAGQPELASIVDYPTRAAGGPRGHWCRYEDALPCLGDPARLSLRSGRIGRRLRARHAILPSDLLPASARMMFQADPDVTVQLIGSSGDCWSARFSSALKNTRRRFRARFVGTAP